MKPALVVLAAGASERLGRNKALVRLGDSTILEQHLAAGSGLDDVPPLVVTGKYHEEIAAHVVDRAECVFNPNWSEGRTGGIRLARERRPGRALLLAPVDVPAVPREVFDALCARWLEAGAPENGWLAPSFEGRFGHPVVVGPALLERISEQDADLPLKTLRVQAEPLLALACDSAAILNDLDTPEDLRALERDSDGRFT